MDHRWIDHVVRLVDEVARVIIVFYTTKGLESLCIKRRQKPKDELPKTRKR